MTREKMVSRSAPQEAWDVIDETLSLDSQSRAFDASLRDNIAEALTAMVETREMATARLVKNIRIAMKEVDPKEDAPTGDDYNLLWAAIQVELNAAEE